MILVQEKVPHRASEYARSKPYYSNHLITYEGVILSEVTPDNTV